MDAIFVWGRRFYEKTRCRKKDYPSFFVGRLMFAQVLNCTHTRTTQRFSRHRLQRLMIAAFAEVK
jgi:hypothetical protein